ncbi:MAG: DUF1285 domain-containing protein [Deltaproteobacteria bacterium]|nr:DUF1285 domain-containing protein [Deltaproteobacteria bacterium]
MMMQSCSDRQGEIKIDKEGNWFFNGAPIINKQIVELFNAGIEHDGCGGYLLHIGAEISPIVVEDTPYVVTHLEQEQAADGAGGFMVRLSDGSRERLSFETFYLSADNIPYCAVKGGQFPARFLRAPYYELARYIEQEGDGRFSLTFNGMKHFIDIRTTKSR